MRVLDLFCGAGGASMGLHQAGYDVVGVDIKPQPNYPFEFIQGDATKYPLGGFDLVWASPPCQRYSSSTLGNGRNLKHPDLIGPVRKRLEKAGAPWVIENVTGAPMRKDAILCGSMFGLSLRRHRLFEASFTLSKPPRCDHSYPVVGVYGHPHGKSGAWPGMLPGSHESWSDAMGIDWMTTKELSQAIPPAYSEFIARQHGRQR